MNNAAVASTRPFAVVGVDPGRKGALAIVVLKPKLELGFVRIDSLSRDPSLFAAQVKGHIDVWREAYRIVGVSLEEPFAHAGSRGTGQGHMLSYGRSFGHLEMAIHLAMPPNEAPTCVYPAQWQPKILPKKRGTTAKEFAIYAFAKLFGTSDPKALHEGVVDAALIAVARAVAEGFIERPAIDFSPFGIDPLTTTPTTKGTSTHGNKRRRKLPPYDAEPAGGGLFAGAEPAAGSEPVRDDEPIDVGF